MHKFVKINPDTKNYMDHYYQYVEYSDSDVKYLDPDPLGDLAQKSKPKSKEGFDSYEEIRKRNLSLDEEIAILSNRLSKVQNVQEIIEIFDALDESMEIAYDNDGNRTHANIDLNIMDKLRSAMHDLKTRISS